MNSLAEVVKMARHYSTHKAPEIIMHFKSEDGSSSSSEDSEVDTEASEVEVDQLEFNSLEGSSEDLSEGESGEEMVEVASGCTSKMKKSSGLPQTWRRSATSQEPEI